MNGLPIEKQIDALEQEIIVKRNKLHQLQNIVDEKENKKLVGKCYKDSNSYGDGDRWWVYYKVFMLDDGDQICHTFQKDCRGKISVNFKALFTRYESQIEITPEEFECEWGKIKKLFVY